MSSSPYVKLGSRSLDQWKVTELKEELKRRKLATRGLKEDLVKRLDEAVRTERESVVEYADNDASQSDLPSEQANPETNVSAEAKDIGIVMVEKVDQENNDQRGSLEMNLVQETKVAGLEGEQVAVETSVVMSEKIEIEPLMSGSQLHIDGTNEDGDSTAVINNQGLSHSHENASLEPNHDTQSTQINKSSTSVEPSTEPMENDESKSLNQPDSIVQPLKYQVSEVDPDLGFQVTSDSVSTESVSIIEKNELKVDVITDNVQLEIDLKHEMAQPSSSSRAVLDGGISHPMGVEEPIDKKDSGESVDKNNIGEPIDKKDIGELIEKNDIEDPIDKKDIGEPMDKDDIGEPIDKKDFGEPLEKTDFEEPLDEKLPMEATGVSSAENVDGGDFAAEKLSLDRSSGDDSMEEDVLDCKQLESDKISDVEKSAMPIGKEDDDVDVVGHDKLVESKASNANDVTVSAPTTVKRKFHDKEAAVANNDTVKKPRRWNAEGLKGSEPHSGNIVTSISPKGLKPSAGTNSIVNEAPPKERIVPPSSKPPSNSLRIDRFLRPFTLKAVQELLGKTGTVTSFWMDNIKTHCYVSYSSVEEAQETRNAVYNLQWPPNGGRLLVADFVDAQEVKTRADAPLASPLTPSTNAAPNFATVPPQPTPRQQVPKRQQLVPPPSLPPPPPPPPLSNPPLVRERLNLPPPPPLPEKVEPPIVTLDDLFRKTKAIPRIYYLPLSDDQVAAKLKTHGKNVN